MPNLLAKLNIKKLLGENRLAGNLAIYFFGTFLLKGISLITTPIFTRVLSTTDYGIISIYQTWVSIFAIFIGLQMSGSIATARIHQTAEEFAAYLRSVLGLAFLSFSAITIVSLLFNNILAELLQLEPRLVPLLLVQAFATSCGVFYLSYSIQTKQPKKHLFFSVSTTISMIALSLSLVLWLDDDKYMGRIIGALAVGVAGIIYVYRSLFFNLKTKIRRADWNFALPLSLPLIIHLASNVVIGQSDRLVINKYLGYEPAAIYSVAYTIGTLGLMIAEATNNVWSPWYLDKTKSGLTVEISNVAKFYIIGISYVFTGILLIAPEVLAFMAPEIYFSGLTSLLVVTCSVFFQFLYRFPLAYEQFSRKMKWVSVATITSAFVNLGLNYIFVPIWGIIGSAIATLLSYILLFGMHEYIARKIIKGYNISFANYLPGIFIVISVAVVSYYLTDFWVARYMILMVLTTIFLYSLWKKNKLRTNGQ